MTTTPDSAPEQPDRTDGPSRRDFLTTSMAGMMTLAPFSGDSPLVPAGASSKKKVPAPTQPLRQELLEHKREERDGGLDIHMKVAVTGQNGTTVISQFYSRRVETAEGFTMSQTVHQRQFAPGTPRTGKPDFEGQKAFTVTGRRGEVNASGIRYDDVTLIEVLADGTTKQSSRRVAMNTQLTKTTAGMSVPEIVKFASNNCHCNSSTAVAGDGSKE